MRSHIAHELCEFASAQTTVWTENAAPLLLDLSADETMGQRAGDVEVWLRDPRRFIPRDRTGVRVNSAGEPTNATQICNRAR